MACLLLLSRLTGFQPGPTLSIVLVDNVVLGLVLRVLLLFPVSITLSNFHTYLFIYQ